MAKSKKFIPLLGLLLIGSAGQAQISSEEKASRIIRRYLSGSIFLETKKSYYYLLYSDNRFKNIEKDSALIRKFLLHPNTNPHERSYFLTSRDHLKDVLKVKDSVIVYGYFPGKQNLLYEYETRKAWSRFIKLKYSLPKYSYAVPGYNIPMTPLAGHRQIPYYMLPNRYDYFYKVKKTELRER